MQALDTLIVGGGPAGLSTALYLARFRRKVLVADAGGSRARYIPRSFNYPGFPDGISGKALQKNLTDQAKRYGAGIIDARVSALRQTPDGFVALCDQGPIFARRVVLATGITDKLPTINGIESAIEQGIVRLCAICDAYETHGRKVGVYGPASQAIEHARYLQAFCAEAVALVMPGQGPTAEQIRSSEDAGIKMVREVQSLTIGSPVIATDSRGEQHEVDLLYPCMGCSINSDLALALGAACCDNGDLVVDQHMQTTVNGLYAVGDVVKAVNQLAVCAGHGAIAATAIHNALPSACEAGVKRTEVRCFQPLLCRPMSCFRIPLPLQSVRFQSSKSA